MKIEKEIDLGDKEKLSLMSKIVNMALKNISDVKIALDLNLPLATITGVRRFWGIGGRKPMSILDNFKKLYMNGQFIFGGLSILNALDLNPLTKYQYKAIGIDKKAKTFTIEIVEQ